MKTKVTQCIFLLLLSVSLFAGLPVGQNAPLLDLNGDAGGRVDDSPWSSSELVGKVWVVVHADPDEADLNNVATEALSDKDFDLTYYGSVALINMAATWKPNIAIDYILKGKQEKYPSTPYDASKSRNQILHLLSKRTAFPYLPPYGQLDIRDQPVL